MKTNLNNKIFKSLANTNNGEVGDLTRFHYRQIGEMIWAEYHGGSIQKGFLIGKVIDDSYLEFVYQHLNTSNEIMSGKCTSTPSFDASGKIILKEEWVWTCKDNSKGKSTLIEI